MPARSVGVHGCFAVFSQGHLVVIASPVGVHQYDGVGPRPVGGVPLEHHAVHVHRLLAEVPLGRAALQRLVRVVLLIPLEQALELRDELVALRGRLAAPVQDALEALAAGRHLAEGLVHQRVAQGEAAAPEVRDGAAHAVLLRAVAVVPQTALRGVEVDGDEVEGAVLGADGGQLVRVALGVLRAAHVVRHQHAPRPRVGLGRGPHHVEEGREPPRPRGVERQPCAALAAGLHVAAPEDAGRLLPVVGVVRGTAVVLVAVGGEDQAVAVLRGAVVHLHEQDAHRGEDAANVLLRLRRLLPGRIDDVCFPTAINGSGDNSTESPVIAAIQSAAVSSASGVCQLGTSRRYFTEGRQRPDTYSLP